MYFDVIESGFNKADETINFGARNIGDTTNLYEVSTIASLKSSDGNASSDIAIGGLIHDQKIFFNIYKTVRVFKDKDCNEIIFNVEFDDIIDAICVSPDSKYLIICLRNGMVYVVDFESDEKNILYSHPLVETTDSETCYVNCFVQEVVENSIHFLIVTSQGVLISLIITNDVEVNVSVEEKLKFGHRVNIAAYSYPNLMVNGSEMSVFDVEENSLINDESPDLKKVFPVGRKFLGLTNKGKLLHICSCTLLTFNIEMDSNLKDISVISVSNKHNILAITEKENFQYIELFSYKEFDTIFSIKVNNDVILLKEESLIEETIFLSKIIHDTKLNEIRFCTVNETEPELRLERLVRKQKFEEAEKFAEMFKLDTIIIDKAKVENIMNDGCETQEIDKLFELLDKIDDIQFKLMVCSAADSYCNHLNDIRRILVYGATLSVPQSDELIEKQKDIISFLYKFDTFLSLNFANSVQDWLKFSESDIIEILRSKLQQHLLKDAVKIYSRIGENLTCELTDVQLKDILTVLNKFSLNDYKLFLPIFLSTTFTHQPTVLPIFVKWIIDKIYYLERDDNAQFPENAIQFVEIILHQLKIDSQNVRVNTELNLVNNDCKNTLYNSITLLKDIQTLKNNYCININLGDYSSEPQNVVRTLLNIPMCSEDYEQFLNGFLLNYMVKNRLDHNEILLNEIQCLVNCDENHWNNLVPSILKCITSVEFKLNAVKIILEKSKVPWCDNIRKIATSVLHYDHRLVDEIKSIIEFEPNYVVLRRPEYKFTDWDFQSRNLECIIYRIMHLNGPTAIEDAYTFCNNDKNRYLINGIVVNSLIQNGKYDDALIALNNNNSDIIFECSRSLIRMAALHIDRKTTLSHHYYNIIGSLFNSHQTHKPLKHFNFNYIDAEMIHYIRSVYNIYDSSFKRNIKTNDLISNKQKKQIYSSLLEDLGRNFAINQNILTCISDCKKIATYLRYKEEQVLVDFCCKIENFETILSVGQYLYENDTDSKTLCTTALLLLKYANGNNINEQTFDETFNFDEVNDTSSDNSLQLALKLVHKGLVNASVYDFTACMEVMNWVEVCVTSNGKIQSSAPNRIQEISESAALHSVRRIFDMYCCFVDQYKHQNLLCLTQFCNSDIKLTEDDLLREIKVLPNTVDSLCKDGQYLIAYKLIFSIQNAIQIYGKLDKNNLKTVNALIKKCISHLLHFVIIPNDIDQTMLFTLLLLCGGTDAIKYISQFLRMCKRQPNKLNTMSQIAIKIIDHFNIHINKEPLITSILTVKWWKRIHFCKIPYDTFFKSTATVRLEMMMKFCYIDEFSLEEYCRDFNLDVQQFYIMYLKYTLINYKPEYDVITDMTGEKKLSLKDSEKELTTKCLTIIKFVSNKDSILPILDEIWNKLNYYYYEVFQCILKIRKTINNANDQSKNLEMLHFLKSYHRISPPSQMETEQWYTIYPDEHAIEPLSEFRLPFTPILFTSEIWNIIRPEINLKSYKFWINMSDLLKPHLNDNDICAIAVKDVAKCGILNNRQQTDEWCLIGKHEDLFLEIDACLKHMSNLEVCTSAIYYVMAQAPRGADQVDAAALCYKYALEYKKKFPDDEGIEKAFKKVKNKYTNVSATHTLYMHQLNDECYLELANRPEELIIALYMDKRILKKIDTVDPYCPDINSAVDTLALLFDLDIFEIRKNLLTSLLSNSVGIDLNSTLLMLECIQKTNRSDCDDDNLKRSAYICQSSCETINWPEELLKLSEQCNESAKNSLFKARILKCFCLISDKTTIKNMTGLEFEAFLDYIDKLLLLSELEYFCFEMDVTKLDQCNKKGLLKRLAKQTGDKVKCINLMAAVCMTYNIYELKYWEFIINSAISLKMFKELKIYMEFIKCCHYYKPFSINAWQVIIDNAFSLNLTDCTTNEEIVELMVENYLMIQSCPVLYSLNFETIIKKLIELSRSTFAAVLLQYLPEEKRELYAEEIKKFYDPKLLNCLSERGICDLL